MHPGVSARRKIGCLRSKTGPGDFKRKIKEERQTINKEIQIVEEHKANYPSEM